MTAAVVKAGGGVMTRKSGIALLACVGWFALSMPYAMAEKVRGTETCTVGDNERTIGGKKYNCRMKCSTPVTDTTCSNGACQTTVSIEHKYSDCTEKAAKTQFKAPQKLQKQPQVLEPGASPGTPGKDQQKLPTSPGLLLQP
jgi:hypothetical protein